MSRKSIMLGDTCKDCGQILTAGNASFSGIRLRSRCRTCTSKHQWKIGKVLARERDLKLKFDLTPEEYKAKVELQLGGCAICKYPCVTGNQLCVDHDHKTNMIRDLLCGRCNKVLGLVKEDEELLFAFIEYLKRWEIVENRG